MVITPECVILTYTQSQINSVCLNKNGALLNMQHADVKSLLAAGSTWTKTASFISAGGLVVRAGVCLIHHVHGAIQRESISERRELMGSPCSDNKTSSNCVALGQGPDAVVKAACVESRRPRVWTPLWPSSFKLTNVSSALTRKDSILWGVSVTNG